MAGIAEYLGYKSLFELVSDPSYTRSEKQELCALAKAEMISKGIWEALVWYTCPKCGFRSTTNFWKEGGLGCPRC